jgi:two-component system, LytTR family, sensor kinase
VFFGAWLVWSALIVWLLTVLGEAPNVALVDGLVSNALLIAANFLVINNLKYYQPRHAGKYAQLLVVSLVLTGIWLIADRWVLFFILTGKSRNMEFVDESLVIRFTIGFLINGFMIAITAIYYSMQDRNESIKRRNDSEQLSRDAELYKLRQQLQPHFLFNSLNSISALISSQPEAARNMIQQVSDFLRFTLKKEEHQWVTLRDELQYLQLYLDIEKVRFGHRLNTEIRSDENVLDLKLPALLLQPIVENAIKFGLYDTTEAITIRIESKLENGNLLMSVENPFDPQTSSLQRGAGFGLNSVRRRLYLLLNRQDLLETKNEGNIFITTIKIPQQ